MRVLHRICLGGALLWGAPSVAATVTSPAVGCIDRDEVFRVVKIAQTTDDKTFMDEMIRLKAAGQCTFLREGAQVKILEKRFGTVCVTADPTVQCLWTIQEAVTE